MIEMAKAFLANFHRQGHVHVLIKHADVAVTLLCEQQSIQLAIKNGEISVIECSQQALYMIHGNQYAMKHLFEGTEKLRVLEQKGFLKVVAPLRTTLLLESLFFLTKVQENFAKVI